MTSCRRQAKRLNGRGSFSDAIVGAIVAGEAILLAVTSNMAGANDRWVIIVVTDVETQASRVDTLVAPQEESTEDGLGHDVQHAVEDGLGVGSDEVATLGQSPGDGVKEPEEDGPDTADEVGLADVGAEGGGVLAGGPDDGPGDPEEGDIAKDVVTPLG